MSSFDESSRPIKDLCRAISLLSEEKEIFFFLKDLCTPAELSALAERWQICLELNQGHSYRDIHSKLGSSLTTITRVARFLKDEPYNGYASLLKKWENNQ